MNIIFTIDDPFLHFLNKNNKLGQFNDMLKNLLQEFSLASAIDDNDADIIFFLTKKDFSKKGRIQRFNAKKQKKSVPLLSCQEMITRSADNFISFIKERIRKMLIWPLANTIPLDEARSVAINRGKNIILKDDPRIEVAERRLGKKEFRRYQRRGRLKAAA